MESVADRDELLRILTDRARDGSVTAAKALLEELRRDEEDSDGDDVGFEVLDGQENVRPIRKTA